MNEEKKKTLLIIYFFRFELFAPLSREMKKERHVRVKCGLYKDALRCCKGMWEQEEFG